MKTTKTLMLAGFAALALGAGAAMAQEGGPSMPTVDFSTAQSARHAAAPAVTQVQSGSSDTDAGRTGVQGWYNYGTLANPG